MAAEEVIILAGGLGTRLRPVVDGLPKALAPVAGRPFLAWVLDQLAAAGMRRAILATGYLAAAVRDAIGTRWGTMAIAYSVETEPLGTGGAVRLAAAQVAGEGVHVVNGDTFLRYAPRALEHATRAAGALGGIALAHVPDAARYGTVEVAGGRIARFLEKGRQGPGLINAGCYFLSADGLRALPERTAFSLESHVWPELAAAGQLAAMEDTDAFIDIGVPDDYARAQRHFAAA